MDAAVARAVAAYSRWQYLRRQADRYERRLHQQVAELTEAQRQAYAAATTELDQREFR